MVKIAIFASGSGSNFENIVEHVESGKLENIEVTALYTDHQNAFCIDRAKKHDIPVYINEPKQFDSKAAYEQHLVTLLNKDKVEWIILAGYMRLIGPDLLASFEGKILNIHPSLLPKYKGIDAIGKHIIVAILLLVRQYIMLIVVWIREKLLNRDNVILDRTIQKNN